MVVDFDLHDLKAIRTFITEFENLNKVSDNSQRAAVVVMEHLLGSATALAQLAAEAGVSHG